jgi:flagellum-specific peptidoglycan hydrolase FlgJ
MRPSFNPNLPARFDQRWNELKLLARNLWDRHWTKVILLGCLYWLLQNRDITINLSFNRLEEDAIAAAPAASSEAVSRRAMNVSLLNGGRRSQSKRAATAPPPPARPTPAPAAPAAEGSKRDRQLAYVRKYAPLAKAEMRKYGIPASITLAQGLLESNVGSSKLALENNNHFGIKCFSRTCRKGHCSNFTDDSHKDFFRIFGNVADSYHSHSQLLKQPRYRSLFKLKRSDYRGWAKGLKKAGYATDDHYDEKLINLIEALNLFEYDR